MILIAVFDMVMPMPFVPRVCVLTAVMDFGLSAGNTLPETDLFREYLMKHFPVTAHLTIQDSFYTLTVTEYLFIYLFLCTLLTGKCF